MRFGTSRLLLLVSALLCTSHAAAACWDQAAARYGVNAELLKAIGWVESNWRADAVGPPLSDGNVALGLMQINTVHLPKLALYGIRREDLFNACVSQNVGAWVLADCMRRFGNTWKAVGCYNTGPASNNEAAQLRYVAKVSKHFARFKSQAAARPQQLASTSTFLQSAE